MRAYRLVSSKLSFGGKSIRQNSIKYLIFFLQDALGVNPKRWIFYS